MYEILYPKNVEGYTDHSSNCYFCMVNASKCWVAKNAHAIICMDIPSSIAPVSHCPEFPMPTPLEKKLPSLDKCTNSENEVDIDDLNYFSSRPFDRNPYYPYQNDLIDLIRDLGLTKSNAELWNVQAQAMEFSG